MPTSRTTGPRRPLRRFAATLVGAFLAVTPVAAADDLFPSADTYVKQRIPHQNHGLLRTIRLGADDDGLHQTKFNRGYFRFNISAYPRGARVVSARLYWYQEAGGFSPNGMTFEACIVTGSWRETGLTWQNKPTHGASMDTEQIAYGAGWKSWDIRPAVQGWIDGSIPNYGVVLKEPTESRFLLARPSRGKSREATTNRPYLRVVIEEPSLPGTGGAVFWGRAGSTIRANNVWGIGASTNIGAGAGALDIEVDATRGHLYWITAQTLNRCDADAGNVTTLATGLQSPGGLGLDAFHGKVYWTETATQTLKRANLDGTGVETVPTSGIPRDVAIDPVDARVFYNDAVNARIFAADFDGANVSTLVSASWATGGLAVDLVRRRVMWTNANSGSIESKPFDGGAATRHFTGLNNPGQLSFDSTGNRVAWTQPNRVFASKRNGTEKKSIALSTAVTAVAIAPLFASAPATVQVGQTVSINLVGSDLGARFAGAASFGTTPGVAIDGGRTIPLNPDNLMVLSATAPGLFRLAGTLDATNGAGRGQIVVPNIAGLAGTSFSAAFVTIDVAAPENIRAVSNAVTLQIIP